MSESNQNFNNSHNQPLLNNVDKNISVLKKKFGNSSDFCYRKIFVNNETQIGIIYFDQFVDTSVINKFIEDIINQSQSQLKTLKNSHIFQHMKSYALSMGTVDTAEDFNGLALSILSGNTGILIDNHSTAITSNTKKLATRQITEPTSQSTIKGPKDSFGEDISINISLVRRRIKNPNLWINTIKLGKVTQTYLSIVYINGIASNKIVNEVMERIKKINVNSIIDSGYVEAFIQDGTLSPFPTIYSTERPDSVVGNLLEGRIALFIDGSPFVLILPTILPQFLQSPEDYYNRIEIATMKRILRYICLFITIYGQSLYILAASFHPEMIPTNLLISLVKQRENVPFPILFEALFMELGFEILREAGIRMPKTVGQAVSVLGALVIGQAAVEAGIISATMVIIVSITGIAGFSIPSYDFAKGIQFIRFTMMILSGVFGILGVTLGSIILIAHLSSLRSFGIPYLFPYAPFKFAYNKDTIIRAPLSLLLKNEKVLNQKATGEKENKS